MSKDKGKPEKGHKAAPAKLKPPAEKTFLARVYVSLKPVVNDPEGITIGGALGSLGFTGVRGVRSGRYFQVTLAGSTSIPKACSSAGNNWNKAPRYFRSICRAT